MSEPQIDPQKMVAAAERGARSVLHSPLDVEDAAQDACLRALGHFQAGVRPKDAEAWMFRVAQNTARRLIAREQRFRCNKVDVEDLAAADAGNVRGEIVESAAKSILEVLHSHGHILTQRQRDVVLTAIDPGISMHEAARRLGTDSSTLRRDLLRAARKIRSKMAPPQDP